MARIRSIKPEFWIDEHLTECTPWSRLLFIGLWNFADDQGYVDDKPKRIKAQVFPNDEIDVAPLLDELVERGRLVRYDSPVGPVLHIKNWLRHQKVDKAGSPRFDASTLVLAGPRETSRAVSSPREDSRASLATEGKGSGNRSGVDLEVPPTAALARADDAPSVQTLIGEWLTHCRKRPPDTVIGQVSKQVKAMLAEGIDPGDVRAGLAAWHQRGVHPSVLPSMVNEVMNGGATRASPSRPSTTDRRVADNLALVARFEALEEP